MRRVRVVTLSLVAVLLVVVLAACSSGPTGSLKVTVSGLPSGVSGAVGVTGPGGYSKTVTATSVLSNLAVGTYSVVAAAALNGNGIVPTVYDGSVSSSTVIVQQSAIVSTTASYVVRPGSGHLWVPVWPGGPGEAVSYASGSLASPGTSTVDVTLTSSSNEGEAAAFDHAGNLWVSDSAGYIFEYDVAQLDGSGATTPAMTIDATAYGGVTGLAFDASGNLWAGDFNSSQVLEYTPAQLALGGAVTPTAVISPNATPSLARPEGLAFDVSGNLWVANSSSSVNTVVAFTPGQLAVAGNSTPDPAVTIGANGTPSLSRPGGLAFDASGNLWVANLTNNTVVRFGVAQLVPPGGPLTPEATIASGSFASNGGPWGLAFDASGALWVGESYVGELRRFTSPDTFNGTVTPAADSVISSVPSPDEMQIAFSPPPTTVPIHTP